MSDNQEPPVVEIHVESSPIFFEVPNPNNGDTPEEQPTWADILQATVGSSS